MKAKEVKEIFDKEYNGQKNFLTPNVLYYEDLGNGLLIEVSTGSGLNPESTIYGVTVLENSMDGINKRYDLSASFMSEKEAEDYIETLRNLKK